MLDNMKGLLLIFEGMASVTNLVVLHDMFMKLTHGWIKKDFSDKILLMLIGSYPKRQNSIIKSKGASSQY